MGIPLIYCASPYRAPTRWGITENIHKAQIVGARVAQMGGMPVIPHLMSAGFEDMQNDEFWLAGLQAVMLKCDALVLSGDWDKSAGCQAERMAWVKHHNKPVVYWHEGIAEIGRLHQFIKEFKQ